MITQQDDNAEKHDGQREEPQTEIFQRAAPDRAELLRRSLTRHHLQNLFRRFGQHRRNRKIELQRMRPCEFQQTGHLLPVHRTDPELSAAAGPVEPADRLRRNRQPRRQLTKQHLALRTPLQGSRQGNIINHRPGRTSQQTDEIRFIRGTVLTESKLPPDMPDTLIIPLNQRIIFRNFPNTKLHRYMVVE